MHIAFNGKILIIGCGAVSQCLQQLLVKHIDTNFRQVTILDELDRQDAMQEIMKHGAQFIQQKITRENYASILDMYLASGDLLIDLTVNVESQDLIDWCQSHNVMYINSALEWWEDPKDSIWNISDKHTLYTRHLKIRTKAAQSWSPSGPTAVIEHGANPGLVSHWTKKALLTIAQLIIKQLPADTRRAALEKACADKNYPELAFLTGTKVIHISERDMQISNKPKQVNEFVNTWSISGLYEEGTAPAELGWGTHERTLPAEACEHISGPRNQIYLNRFGIDTFMYSWVPQGEIIGMLIRHGEAFTLSDYLTIWQDNKALYRPTVHYVYLPSNETFSSLHELKMNKYILQKQVRIMQDDIIAGSDQLGVLLLGHDLNGWWIGSQLTIEETRNLVTGQNATTLQVAASMLGALFWMIKNPHKGFCTPEDLPHEEVLAISDTYLGHCPSVQTTWAPQIKDKENLWQFSTFRADCC